MIQQAKLGKVRGTILILIGTVMGAMLIQPAVAHLGDFGHLKDHFLTRAAGAINTDDINDFTSPTFTTILSKNINAPSGGFLAITGSVGVEDDCSFVGSNDLLGRLRVDGTPVTNDPFAFETSTDCDQGIFAGTISLDAVVKVSPGSHSVDVQAREVGSGSYIIGRSLNIVFIPTGSGVSIPVPARPSSESSSQNRP
ncbi:MAG TPA: hypothetical protein VHL78_14215 [Actinomycetota bacterium]|nr:hypothetical protein [Actinomycetota bacterium]